MMLRDTGDHLLTAKQLSVFLISIDLSRNGRLLSVANSCITKMPVSDSLEALALRQEARRFESFSPNIQSLYDLLEEVDNVPLKRRMRELVNRIEGKSRGLLAMQIPIYLERNISIRSGFFSFLLW